MKNGPKQVRPKTNAVSRKLARAGPPRRHAVEQPVSHHQRVKQHGRKMGEEGEEQEIGKKRVYLPQGRVQYRTVRKDGKKMH